MQSKRNGDIDFLRFVFSIVVLISHFNANYNFGFFSNGSIAVEFFFVVTGYLLASHVSRMQHKPETWSDIADSTWVFILKKAKSFFHYYICVFLLNLIIRIILVHGADMRSVLTNLFRSIPTITLTFMGLNNCSVELYVGNTWYLSAMLIAIFMLYPLLLKNFDFSTKILFPLVSMFILGYLYSTYNTVTTWDKWTGICETGILRATAEIALGASLFHISALLAQRCCHHTGNKYIVEAVLLTLIKCGCYLAVLLYAYGISFGAGFSLHALLLCSIGIALSFSCVGYTLPDCRLTRYLGRISLPIFVFHGFIRWTLKDITGKNAVSLNQSLSLICVAFVLSILLMHITDFFTTRLKKHLQSK